MKTSLIRNFPAPGDDVTVFPELVPGCTVVWDSHSNLGICRDVVREVFWQDTGWQSGIALCLTHYSWVWASQVIAVE